MKIVFFVPELLRSYKEIPSLTTAQFKSFLEDKGFDLKILVHKCDDNPQDNPSEMSRNPSSCEPYDDSYGHKLVKECVLKANYLFSGTCEQRAILVSSWYYNLPFALEFIKEYKKTFDDGSIIILGGYAATYSTHTIFEILGNDLDFIIRGNGYIALDNLLKEIGVAEKEMKSHESRNSFKGAIKSNLNNLKNQLKNISPIRVKGVSYMDKGSLVDNGLGEIISLDELPMPDYSFTGSSLIHSLYMKTSDGCKYNLCSFCTSEKFNDYQEKSIDNVKKELLEYKKRYHTQVIQFTDNTFLCNPERAIEISRFLKQHDFYWFCYSRIEVDENLLKTIIKNNCRKIFFGYDTPTEKDFIENNKSKISYGDYLKKSKRLFSLMSELKRSNEDFFADFAVIDFSGRKRFAKNDTKNGIHIHKSKIQHIPGTKYYESAPDKFIFDDNANFFYAKYEHFFQNSKKNQNLKE